MSIYTIDSFICQQYLYQIREFRNLMTQTPGKITLIYSLHQQTHQFIQRVCHLLKNHQLQFSIDKQSICQTIIDCFHITSPRQTQDLPHYLQSLLDRQVNKRLNIHQEINNTNNSDFSLTQKSIFKQFQNTKDQFFSFEDSQLQKKSFHIQGSSFRLFSTQSHDFDSSIEYFSNEERKLIQKKRFTKKIKEQISEYCKNYGIEEASLKYSVPVHKINHWNNIQLKRGRKPIDIQMQNKLCEWISEELRKGKYITQKIIRQQAKKFSNLVQFMASKGWLEKLFRRRPQILQAYNRHKETLKLQKEINKQNREKNLQQSLSCQCQCKENEVNVEIDGGSQEK